MKSILSEVLTPTLSLSRRSVRVSTPDRMLFIIGSHSRLPKPIQQRCSHTTLRYTNPKLRTAHPERSRHRFGEAFFLGLLKSVVNEKDSDCFEPQPSGAKRLQLFLELGDGRCAPLLRETEQFIAAVGHFSPVRLALNGGHEHFLKLEQPPANGSHSQRSKCRRFTSHRRRRGRCGLGRRNSIVLSGV